GQIFLESDLFLSGVRPAINVGISVSRVGGNAQIKSMKKVAGTLKIDLAQYRELEAFSKFGSDLDAATQAVLDKGKRNVELLIQPEHTAYKVEHQVALVYAGSTGLLNKVPVEKVKDFIKDYIGQLDLEHKETLENIRKGQIDDDIKVVLTKVSKSVADKYVE
ncbi:MAG: F0F1 ATP synthase subunit alpha, partial [Salinivirgaceae bacterium]